jgi:inner membrane protein
MENQNNNNANTPEEVNYTIESSKILVNKNNGPNFFERNKLLIKCSAIFIIIMFLQIPQFFINEMVHERQGRQNEVSEQIMKTYGNSQTVAGPILAIPYKSLETTNEKEKPYFIKRYAYIMPENLEIIASLKPDTKRVSIFNVSTYESAITAKGNFKNINWQKLNIASEDVYWNDVRMLIGISDYKGLLQQATVTWDGKQYTAEAGFEDKTVLDNALQIAIPISIAELQTEHNFTCSLALRGTKSLDFIPVANQTNVSVETKWSAPRFTGNYPATHNNDFDKKPLIAKWSVLGINKNFPQIWKNQSVVFNNDAFGISLIEPIDSYAKTIRSVKYGMLIIALTFLIYFFVEIRIKKTAHAIQYILVGFALIIFYLLLLSISEYIGFNLAYLCSCIGTIGLISIYTGSVFADKKIMFSFAGFLSLIYLFIYLLIQLEDGALLIGSIGLFVILGLVMYGSKKINWKEGKLE